MSLLGTVRGLGAGADPVAITGLCLRLLERNRLRAADVVAAVVRGPLPARDAIAALRGAGVTGVPVFSAGGAGAASVELHVRLRRRRRLTDLGL